MRSEYPAAIHSRVASIQSFGGSATRSGTPKIPPGLESLHAHPSPTLAQDDKDRLLPITKLNANTMTTPMVPAVPMIPIGTPKSKVSQTAEDKLNKTKDEVSHQDRIPQGNHGSICKKSPAKIAKSENDKELELKTGPTKEQASLESSRSGENKEIEMQDTSHPTKIEISQCELMDEPKPPIATVEKLPASMLESSVVRTPDVMSSRPPTPTTSTSEARRPRTLRLTTEMIQKAQKQDAAALASATTEKSSVFPSLSQIRQFSRQPSISTSRPSTPAASEFLMSQEVSRAGSPPPSVVGSAPTRGKTKNQLKKERKEKARKATETSEGPSTPSATTPATEAVAPIVARQKKQKKQKPVSSIEEPLKTTTSRTKMDKRTQSTKDEQTDKDNRSEEKNTMEPEEQAISTPLIEDEPLADTAPKQIYTLRDIYSEATKLPPGTSTQPLLNERVSHMSKLLAEMVASGDLSKDHPWFTPPSFNSSAYKLPNDSRRGQEYLDGNGYSTNDAFGYVYLPQKEKRALFQGHAVSVADSGDRKNDLLRRCLITPNGWVMRHLSAEDSERVLELEERRSLYAEEFGEVGGMNGLGVLEQDDFINLGGGFEELARFGDRHGVCWVVGDDQQADDDFAEMEDGDLLEDGLSDATDDDLGIDLSKIDDLIPAEWDVNDADTNVLPPNTLPPIQGQYGRAVNLRAMDSETLQKRVYEKHKEAEGSRKDMEKAEKILGKRAKDLARWRDSVFKG